MEWVTEYFGYFVARERNELERYVTERNETEHSKYYLAANRNEMKR